MDIPRDLYKHFKGGRYNVLNMAVHSETKENLVIYRSVTTGEVFARPVSMWLEEVQWPDGTKRPRFVPEE